MISSIVKQRDNIVVKDRFPHDNSFWKHPTRDTRPTLREGPIYIDYVYGPIDRDCECSYYYPARNDPAEYYLVGPICTNRQIWVYSMYPQLKGGIPK